ncbi:MAG: ABC transporter permease [Desulfonatronovibrio sp.]
MLIKANIKEALRSLASSKQRTALALLGIVIGIGSVIALVSIGSLAQRETMRQFLEMGTDVISIQEEEKRESRSSGQSSGLKLDDVLEMPQNLPFIRSVAPYASAFGELRKQGQRKSVPALGVTGSFLEINSLDLAQGRFISDLDTLMPFAVLGGNLARMLAQQGIVIAVGDNVYFENRKLTVVGILHPSPMGSMRPYESTEGLMLPISTVQRMSPQNIIRTVMARVDPEISSAAAAEEIKNYFSSLPRSRDVRITSPEQIIEHMEKQSRMFTLLLGAIGSISLVVGGVGVMNVMLVSVSERKKEIGIRRALGAKKKDIQSQFLMESVILSLLGGLLGILIGVGVSYGIARFSGWEFAVVYGAVFVGVGVSVGIGIFFGYYPARQAANLIPIQALRSD